MKYHWHVCVCVCVRACVCACAPVCVCVPLAFKNSKSLILFSELLKQSAPSRIVNVSSGANRHARKGIDFDNLRDEKPSARYLKYATSKLANILFTRELAHRLKATGEYQVCQFSVLFTSLSFNHMIICAHFQYCLQVFLSNHIIRCAHFQYYLQVFYPIMLSEYKFAVCVAGETTLSS